MPRKPSRKKLICLALDAAEAALFRRAEEGDMRAITFLLKTHGADRGYADSPPIIPQAYIPPAILSASNETLTSLFEEERE